MKKVHETAEKFEAFFVGQMMEHMMAGIESDPCKARLRANTDELIARGGFGSPTVFVGTDMFFGNDRMPLVRAALSNS